MAKDNGDSLAQHQAALRSLPQSTTMTEYARAAIDSPDVAHIAVHKYAPGSWQYHEKIDEINGSVEEGLEEKYVEERGAGRYKLLVMYQGADGKDHPLTGRVFKYGDWLAADRLGPSKGVGSSGVGEKATTSTISETVKEIGQVQILKELTKTPPAPPPAELSAMKPLVETVTGILGAVKDSITSKGTDQSAVLLELYKASEARNAKLIELLFQKKADEDRAPQGALKVVGEVGELAEALGWDVKGKGGGVDWPAVINAGAPLVERITDRLADAIEGRPRVVVTSEASNVRRIHRSTANRSSAKEEDPMGKKPPEMPEEFQEVLDTIVTELSKAKEDRDSAALGHFLMTIIIDPDGGTLFDRLVPLSKTKPEFAPLSLRMIDKRLAAPSLQPAVQELLAWVREEIEREGAEEEA